MSDKIKKFIDEIDDKFEWIRGQSHVHAEMIKCVCGPIDKKEAASETFRVTKYYKPRHIGVFVSALISCIPDTTVFVVTNGSRAARIIGDTIRDLATDVKSSDCYNFESGTSSVVISPDSDNQPEHYDICIMESQHHVTQLPGKVYLKLLNDF
jgi:hypothetical protein